MTQTQTPTTPTMISGQIYLLFHYHEESGWKAYGRVMFIGIKPRYSQIFLVLADLDHRNGDRTFFHLSPNWHLKTRFEPMVEESLLSRLINSATEVLDRWEHGDLAGAVRDLGEWAAQCRRFFKV